MGVTMLGAGAGCHSFEPAQYLAVCGQGRAIERAPAHEPQAAVGRDYPVFTALKEVDVARWLWRQELITPPLREAGLVPAGRQNHDRAELVLCVEQTAESLSRECVLEEGTLSLYSGNFRATLREAHTGRVLAARSFAVKNVVCPKAAMVSFADVSPKQGPQPETYANELAALLAAHVPPSVREHLQPMLRTASSP